MTTRSSRATALSARTPARHFAFSTGTVRQKADHTWFRGEHCNFSPVQSDLDFFAAEAPQRFVLHGWAPERPVIGPETKIIAFGSCFAENIANWLAARNFNILTRKDGPNADAYVVRFGEGMVNTFAIRQQFEWAFEGKTNSEELWHGYDAQAFGYDEEIRLRTRAIFDEAEVFVITLGLSEIWYDEVTGGVFWRAVPARRYDPTRHKFRVSTVAENKENLHAILDLIWKHRPHAKVILTMSPIPLVATFRPVSCIVANFASKAILRGALDEVLRERGTGEKLFYWPSYELVLDFFSDRWEPDRRHVKPAILNFIMVLFEHVWCHGTAAKMTIAEALLKARVADGAYPKPLAKLVEAGNRAAVTRWLEKSGSKFNGRELLEARLGEIESAANEHARPLSVEPS